MDVDLMVLGEPTRDEGLLALDEALLKLHSLHTRKSRLVELRYFAGLTVEEVATALKISVATAERDWIFARAWS